MATKSHEMLEESLRDESDTLTAWEIEFLESLNQQRIRDEANWEPTSKQFVVLEKIWGKIFG